MRSLSPINSCFIFLDESMPQFPPTYRYKRGTRESYEHVKIKRAGVSLFLLERLKYVAAEYTIEMFRLDRYTAIKIYNIYPYGISVLGILHKLNRNKIVIKFTRKAHTEVRSQFLINNNFYSNTKKTRFPQRFPTFQINPENQFSNILLFI